MSAAIKLHTRSERPLCLPNRSDLTRTIGDRTLACCRMSSSRTYSLFTMTNSVTHRRAMRQSAKPRHFRGFWWSQTGSNRRPEACKATALPTELWPLFEWVTRHWARRPVGLADLRSEEPVQDGWWAWEDLNLRPHAYQARALTN